MNPHMLDELDRIARVNDISLFRALDKLANSMMGYGGMNPAGSRMNPPPAVPQASGSPGASNMAGMSVHCDRCFAEIQESGAKFCPKCGNRIKAIRDLKHVPGDGGPNTTSGNGDNGSKEIGRPTGGEEAVAEELAEGSYADMGKYSGAEGPWSKAYAHSLGDAAHPLLKKLRAAAAIGGGLYLGAKGLQMTSGAMSPPTAKYAGVPFARGSKFAQLHFHPKGGAFATVEDGITRIKRATRKNTQRILART